MHNLNYHLVATGRPYADFIAAGTSDTLVQTLGFAKGKASAVTPEEMLAVLAQIPEYAVYAGGSPSNTCAIVQLLGGRAAFIGKVCDDVSGRVFREAFLRAGVHFPTGWHVSPAPAVSGTCVILKTPDGAETMIHCPGVGDMLTVDDMDATLIAGAKILYLQSHLLFAETSQEAALYAIDVARRAGALVAFSLHDHQMNSEQAAQFRTSYLTADDLVMGNREEFSQVFGGRNHQATLVVTDGENGALIWHGTDRLIVPAPKTETIVNTIGAGDAFAAGFLYGYACGLGLEECGALGANAAGRIMQFPGGRPQT